MTKTDADVIAADGLFAGLEDDWESASRYLSIFIDEAEHTIDELIAALLTLEAGGGRESIEQLFVAAHRMKGSAASIGLNRVAKLSHLMEDVLQTLVDRGHTLTPTMADAMLTCTDGLRQYVDALKAGRPNTDRFNLLARQLAAARDDEGRGVRGEGRGTSDGGGGPSGSPPSSSPPSEAASEQLAAGSKSEIRDLKSEIPNPQSPIPNPSSPDLHHRVAAAVCEDERDTVLVGRVVFEAGMPQVGLKARLLYDKLSNLGEIRYFDPPVAELDTCTELAEVGFGVATENSPDTLRRLLRMAGIQRLTVEPLDARPTSPQRQPAVPVKTLEPTAKPAETLRVDIERLDRLMNLAGQLAIGKARVAQIAERLNALVSRGSPARVLGSVAAELEKMAEGAASSTAGATLRADVEHLRHTARFLHKELDGVRREVESLVLARACVNDLFESVQLLDRVSDGIHQSVMDTRMLPIGPLFARFHRVIRDMTRANGKDIRLALSGEKTELDKRMIDELADPMIHMIRNAADHGIESPEARAAAGKPRQGTIALEAFHRGGNVMIRVSDDGQGLDHGRIRAKAVEKGLISAADGERMTRQQIHQLAWLPGLSTAEKLTEVSGRGVGMDIVRSKIEELNGTIEIETQPGQGTAILIKLPLTLAILPSLMVEVDGDVFAFPLESVQEIVHVCRRDVRTVRGSPTASVRDRVVSVLTLEEIFNRRRGNASGCPGITCGAGVSPAQAAGTAAPQNSKVIFGRPLNVEAGDADEITLVVIGEGSRQIALAVDRVLGEEDVVIKSIADNYRNVAGIAGASILGDGRVSLILDPPTLLEMSSRAVAAENS